jgi:hypothetical protein
MFEAINGYTKESIIQKIESDFKGRAGDINGYGCEYLTKEGRKCAVGLFIPDGHPGQECGSDVSGLLDKFPDLTDSMPLPILALDRLQYLHDHRLKGDQTIDRQKSILIDWVEANVL